MQYISVNIGTYSIKFLNFSMEKKKIVYHSSREVVMDSDEFNVLEEDVVTDLQFNIISQYLNELEEDYRLILNAPDDIIAERFLDLPVKNKKKAALMVPFQLEEDIPYSISDCHIASSLKQTATGTKALVNFCHEEKFDKFFNKIKQYNVTPKVITSEVSAIENYIANTKEILPQAFCILDIGHTTTKGYFFYDKELKAVHTSYIAGYAVNEAICDAYSITSEEASLYKHQNCFFLTQDQYEQVNEGQRTFALLMDKTFDPLIHELKRWHIGFRVQNGISVSDIFIMGGSSNIKNISTYLTEKMKIPVSTLSTFEETNHQKMDTDERQRRKFALCNIMAQAYTHKVDIINFMQGRFTIQGVMDLPLHSLSFVATRVTAVMFILITSLMVERIFINRDIDSADKKLKALLKNPILKLTPRDQRKIKKTPKPILSKLKRETKTIRQEIKTLQASVQTNALSSLEKISQMVTGLDIEVIQFQSISGGDFTALLQAKEPAVITQVDEIFKNSTIKNLFTEKNMAKRTYTISGSEE